MFFLRFHIYAQVWHFDLLSVAPRKDLSSCCLALVSVYNFASSKWPLYGERCFHCMFLSAKCFKF